jgi:mRNA interferase RelE/StbE
VGEGRYRIDFAPSAERDLAKLPATVQRRIRVAVDRLELDPRPSSTRLLARQRGERRWRIRVGDYRVIYEIHDDQLLVLVVRLGHRDDVYRSR